MANFARGAGPVIRIGIAVDGATRDRWARRRPWVALAVAPLALLTWAGRRAGKGDR